MAVGMIMEFDGWSTDNYDAIAEKINWPANWPDGLSFHVVGPSQNGVRLVEIWESREQYDRWMEQTIQPAIQEVASDTAAANPPPHFTEFSVHRREER